MQASTTFQKDVPGSRALEPHDVELLFHQENRRIRPFCMQPFRIHPAKIQAQSYQQQVGNE